MIFDQFGSNLGDSYDTPNDDSFMVMMRRHPEMQNDIEYAPFTSKAYKVRATTWSEHCPVTVGCKQTMSWID